MKAELKALQAALEQNSRDITFLGSFHARVIAADEETNARYRELADDPTPERADRFIAAQTRAEAMRIPCDRAREACVAVLMQRIGERSRPAIKDALIEAIAKLKGELETFYDENRRRCDALGVQFEEFAALSPIRKRLESDIAGLEVAIPRIDTITPNEVATYAATALRFLEQ
jgi:hypothetical protein